MTICTSIVKGVKNIFLTTEHYMFDYCKGVFLFSDKVKDTTIPLGNTAFEAFNALTSIGNLNEDNCDVEILQLVNEMGEQLSF